MSKTIYSIKIGDTFGRLTVKRRLPKVPYTTTKFECLCDCGSTAIVRKDSLYTGKQVSCGCYLKECNSTRFRTHGESRNRTVEYDTWAHMIRRCHTPTTKNYERYGGRGIVVCDRWRYSYEAFLADMGRRPSAKHSLDRTDNNGNYEPSNCQWVTAKEQCNNTCRNHHVTFQGRTQTIAQWERELGLTRNLLRSRIGSGWPVTEAFTLPKKAKCPRVIECKYCHQMFLAKSGYGGCDSCQQQRKREATSRFNARRQSRKRNRDYQVSA